MCSLPTTLLSSIDKCAQPRISLIMSCSIAAPSGLGILARHGIGWPFNSAIAFSATSFEMYLLLRLTVSNGRTTQVNSTHLLSSDIHPLRSSTCFNPSFIIYLSEPGRNIAQSSNGNGCMVHNLRHFGSNALPGKSSTGCEYARPVWTSSLVVLMWLVR